MRDFVDHRVKPHVADWFEHGDIDLGLMTRGRRARPARHAPGGLRLRRHQRGRRTAWPAWSWRPATRASAAWSRCRARWPCSRSGSSAPRSRSTTWLPRMAAGEAIGCFGLTEPDFGSDPAGMRTRARRDGDDWVLNGTKMWITNGSVADVAVVWAQTDDGTRASAASSCRPTPPGFSAPEDQARSCRCAPRSPPSSCSRTSGCPADACCPRRPGCAGRCPA